MVAQAPASGTSLARVTSLLDGTGEELSGLAPDPRAEA